MRRWWWVISLTTACGRFGFERPVPGDTQGDPDTNGDVTLTVTVTSEDGSSVLSAPAGIACPGACSATFPPGTAVQLTTNPGSRGSFDRWSGDCTGSGPCGLAMTDSRMVGAAFTTKNLVFVTSGTVLGQAVGGLAGADSLCRAAAINASLPGTYVAWLSTSTVNAKTRLGTGRGWLRTDGLPFVDTVADILALRIWYPPRLDENKVDHPVGDVLTGTTTAGTVASATCNDWSAAGNAEYGFLSAGGPQWTDFASIGCTTPSRLYCFGIDHANPVTLPPAQGRRAFFAPLWVPSGGLAGADARCQADAIAAQLTGTYRALLATTTTTAASRFSTAGPPWIRIDGVPLAATAADVMAPNLLAPLLVQADGTYSSASRAWTGAASPTAVGTQTCLDWTSGALANTGEEAQMQLSNVNFFGGGTGASCNNGGRGLYCLEK